MTHHIFLRDSDLWLIVGEVPKKPEEFPMAPDNGNMYHTDLHKWEATLSRLKSGAVRITNLTASAKDSNGEHLVIDGSRLSIKVKEGELYSIEAEVELKDDNPENIQYSYSGAFAHAMEKYNGPSAILRPVVKEEPTEDQDALWAELASMVWGKNMVESAMQSKDYQKVKSKYTLTRK